jgi:uncharacterized protein (DUF1697 family)
MARLIALLRAVNVGGRKLPMAELRDLCGEDLGWGAIETYVQSGNIAFTAPGKAAEIESALEQAVAVRFGFHSEAMVRTAAQWRTMADSNPFADESKREPGRVLVGVPKRALAPAAAAGIAARAAAGERVEAAGGALWFHYPEGVGRSKLTPSLIDRLAGSPVTARNWRTVLALREMLG